MRNLAIAIVILLTGVFASTTAGTFLENPASVESLSRGGWAIDNSAAGFIKNPAALYGQQRSIYLAQGALLEDVQYLSLAYVQPEAYQNVALGGSLIHTGLDGLKETLYDPGSGTAEYTGKSFGYKAQAYIFGAALPMLNEQTAVGLNFKLIHENLLTESALGFGCDLGLRTSWSNLEFGFSALNILQPQMRWSSGAKYNVDRQLLLSTRYHYSPELSFVGDIIKKEVAPLTLQGGIEYKLFSFISLRGSYGSHLALGTGLHYGDLHVDYAYIDTEKYLGKTQYVSLAYDFTPHVIIEKNIVTETITETEAPVAVPTETAEIKPLPLPEPQAPALELVTPDKIIEPVPIEPIVEHSTENLVTISLPEKPTTPLYEYQLAVVSPRYFTSGKLQIKVFVDNIGNQQDTVSSNLTITSSQGVLINSWPIESKILSPKETGVYYFDYASPLKPGTYYLEVKTFSSSVTRYQKEAFIVR